MRDAQKADSPDAAARPARMVRNRRRVRDTWRDHKSGGRTVAGQARSRSHHLGRVLDIYNAWLDRKRGTRHGNAPLSVTHREALARMCRVLDLVRERHGIVLKRDAAAFFIGQQLIAADPEFAGALARHE